jgi:peptidyl-prolyl cis-trans isomerase C
MGGGSTVSEWTRRALREPLVHFLLAGIAVFAFSGLRDQPADPASRTITIMEADVTRLATNWQAAWRRPPSAQELDALIRDHVKEEVYYREALRLGLDTDDPIIRRRLRSKMEFISAAASENMVPTDAALRVWIDRNPARYARDPAFSFDQIYLGQSADRAAATLAQLRAGQDWRTLGQAISLPRAEDGTDRGSIARTFGDDFAAALSGLPVGQWRGPVASGFGQHLVRVRAVQPGALPPLAELRQVAINDWRAETRAAREARAYQTLLDSYRISIARP